MAAAERGADASPIVDLGWRLAGDYSNIADIASCGSVTSSSDYVQPWGVIDVLSGYRVWFFDEGGQAVGVIDTNDDGLYFFNDFGAKYSIYGDTSGTQLDEGAIDGDTLTVVAQKISTNKFYAAEFTNGRLLDEGFIAEGGLVGRNDIHITDTIVPEPATLALMGLGAGVAALTRRRRKLQPDMDSDIGEPEVPYYRKLE